MLDVALRVDRQELVVEVTFRLDAGERLGLYGPSGSGKSTILDAVAGLVRLSAGSVQLDGRDLARVPLWKRRIGLLRQRPGLFPHLNVLDNVLYGAEQGLRADVAPRKAGLLGRGRRSLPVGGGVAGGVQGLCERLGIGHLLDQFPSRLSGGQAQRVALARALVSPCRALLLDEPFQGLDPPLRAELIDLVRDEAGIGGLPVMLVSHELADVQAFADRIGVLDAGRLLQLGGSGEVARRPATADVAMLVGYVAIFDGGCPGERIGVHPDRVRLGAYSDEGLVLPGVLKGGRPRGVRWVAEVEIAGVVVPVACDDPPGWVGDPVRVTVADPPRFGPDGVLLPGPVTRPRVETSFTGQAHP